MTVPTQPVSMHLADFGGPSIAGVTVRVIPTKIDYTADGTFVSTKEIKAVSDAGGVVTWESFPCALVANGGLGTTGSTIRVVASLPGSRSIDVQAATPNAPCNLVDYLVDQEPNGLGASERAASDSQAARDLAKEWATKTDGPVDGVDFSAKQKALDAAADAVLAQKWATQTDTEVVAGQGFGAKKYSQDAQVDAEAAAGNAGAAAGSAGAAAASAGLAAGSAGAAAGSAAAAAGSAAAAATSETNSATSAASALTASATSGAYPNAASAAVPRGITQASVGAITPGAGGTNGTFALGFSAGTGWLVYPTGTFTVAGNVLTSVTITGPGLCIHSAPVVPTVSFAASAGLAGAAVALTAQFLIAAGAGYWAASVEGKMLDRYNNVAGVATRDASVPSIFTVPELASEVGASTDVIVSRTFAALPGAAPVGKYALVVDDRLPVTSTNRSRGNGVALLAFNVAHGLVPGASVNVRGFGGVGYNGHFALRSAAGVAIDYKSATPQAAEASTPDTGGYLDRNGVYQFDGTVWGWVADIGFNYPVRPAAAAASRAASVNRDSLQRAAFDQLFRPVFQPLQRVMTINEVGTLTVDCSVPNVPDGALAVYVDNVLLAYATKSGTTYTVPYTAPGAVDLDVDLKAICDTRIGTAKLAVAEAVRWTQDLTLWTKTNLTSVVGGQSDPDGGNNAYRLLCAATASAQHGITSPAASPVNTGPLTGCEVWVKADTVSKVAIWSAVGGNDIAFVDLVTGEISTQNVNCAIVERRGAWVKIWVQQRLSATAQVWRINPLTQMASVSNATVGTEAIMVYKPRQIDGVLPFLPKQRAAIRNGAVGYATRYIAKSDFMDSAATMNTDINIDVVVPDTYDPTKRYAVLYVREVEATPGTSYLDGLQTLKGMGVHNTYDCIMVRHYHPNADIPWDGVKNDGTMAHATFFEECVVSFIDSKYSTIRSREGRLLIGFSKSGWGAMSYLLRRPDLFGYVAAWDVPWGLQFDGTDIYTLDAFGNPSDNDLAQATDYGTLAQYQLYNPADILVSKLASVNDRCRIVLGGASAWEGDWQFFKGLLDANGVQYMQHYIPSYSPSAYAHNWNAGWAGRMLAMMFSLR